MLPAGATLPVLSLPLASDSVLAPGRREAGSAVAPAAGARPLSKPCSPALWALKGQAAARSLVWAACRARASPATSPAFDGPLSVLRAAALSDLAPLAPVLLRSLVMGFPWGMVDSID
ncbi:hypothetical protein D3C71_1692220 [compost metagenome]